MTADSQDDVQALKPQHVPALWLTAQTLRIGPRVPPFDLMGAQISTSDWRLRGSSRPWALLSVTAEGK